MRVGTLNNCCASLHATKLVSSLCVTAIIMSQSSIPASTSTEGCAALPSTVRKSRRSWRLRNLVPSISTIVMSLASDARFSATDEPTWPAPRITIFKAGIRAKKHAFYADLYAESVFFSPGENAERFQLAVQVRALEPASLGDARYRAVHLRKMMLEVGPLEGLAGLAQGEIERQVGFRGAACELRQHPFRVRDTNLLLQAGERQVTHRRGEILEITRPGEIAQDVEGTGGEVSRRAKACFHQLRKHEGCDLRNVLRMLTQSRKRDDDSRERLHQGRVETLRFHQVFRLLRGEGHQLHVALFRARCEKRQVLLLVPGQRRELTDEQHAAGNLLQQILRRLVEGVRRIDPGGAGLLQIARIELRHHASFAAQQHRCAGGRDPRQALLQLGDDHRAAEIRDAERHHRARLACAQRTLHGREQLLQRDRFFQEIHCADARCLHRRVDSAVTRHHDHRHGELAPGGPFLQERNAVRVGHPNIEQHEVRASLCAQRARSGGILGKLHRVPFVAEDFRQQLPDPDFVVNDQYLRHGRSSSKRKRNSHRRAATPFLPDAVFYPNGTVMLVDDALYDRQPQSRPFGLGGDIGLECPVDDGLGEAATVVADPQPHLAARELGRHFDFWVATSEKGILRVLQQIVDHLSQTVGVTTHQRNVLLEVRLNPSSGLFVQSKYLCNEPVQVQSAQLRRGGTGIVAEIIHHILHGSNLRDDGLRGVVEGPRRLERKFVAEFHLQSLRRELDRGERILDLVSEPARNLAPGGCALRRDQLRDVVEYHDVTAPTGLRQRRTPYENHSPPLAHLNLLLPRGLSVLFELRPQHASKLGERVPILELQSNQGRNVLVQDAARPAVSNPEDKAMIKNEYTRRQIGENALQVRLGGFELRLIEQRGALRFAQLLSHAVERLREDAQLIAARDPGAARKIAARHRLRALGEHGKRFRQAPRQQERECDRRKQSEQQRQGQRENVDFLQPLARQRQLLVCTIHALYRFALFGERLRHPVRELQQARFVDAPRTLQ